MKHIGQRLLLTVTFALVVVVPSLLYPALAGATEVLDQSQTVSQSPQTVHYDLQRAQIFTAGQYGRLDRVSLRLENYVPTPPAGANLTVSVQTVIGGLPSGEQIGSGTIPLTAVPPLGNPGWVDVSITGATFVHPGTQYALVLRTTIWNAVVTWWYAYNSGYAGGEMASNYGDGWITEALYDFTFQTYVVQDVLDQSQTQFGNTLQYGINCGSDSIAQTFTAGQSGVVDRVNVRVSLSTALADTLDATIQTVNSSKAPSGNVIGQGSIPSNFNGWVTVDINDAIITAGTQYALVLRYSGVEFCWYTYDTYNIYGGGTMWWEYYYPNYRWYNVGGDGAFQTYVAPSVASAPPPPPAAITPCSSGVCPAASGSVTPPDSTAGVTSNVQFQERPDGTVHGVLNFNDSKTGNFVLKGCTTDSAACPLTVTTFACTAQDAITVAGTYTPKGGTAADYLLTLSGAKDGVGTFTLTAGDYTYSLLLDGLADVSCPPGAGG